MGWASGFQAGTAMGRTWVDTYDEAVKQKQDQEAADAIKSWQAGLAPAPDQMYTPPPTAQDQFVQGLNLPPDQVPQQDPARTALLRSFTGDPTARQNMPSSRTGFQGLAPDGYTDASMPQSIPGAARTPMSHADLLDQVGMIRMRQGRIDEASKFLLASNELRRQAAQDERATTEFGWRQGAEDRAQTLSGAIGEALKLPDGPEKQQAISAAYAAARDPLGGLQYQHTSVQLQAARDNLTEDEEARSAFKTIVPHLDDPDALSQATTAWANDHQGGAIGGLVATKPPDPVVDAKGNRVTKDGLPVFNYYGMDKSTGQYVTKQMTAQDAMADAFIHSGNMKLGQLGMNIKEHGMKHVLDAIDEMTKANAVGVKDELAYWKGLAVQQKTGKTQIIGRDPSGQPIWAKEGDFNLYTAGGKPYTGDVSQIKGLDAPTKEAKPLDAASLEKIQTMAQTDPRVMAAPASRKAMVQRQVEDEISARLGFGSGATDPNSLAAPGAVFGGKAAAPTGGLKTPAAPVVQSVPVQKPQTVQIGRSSVTLDPTEWILQAPTVRGGKAYYLNIRTQQQIPAN